MKNIFLFAEYLEGRIVPESLSLATVAQEWKERYPHASVRWLFCGNSVSSVALDLAERSGLDVVCFDHPALKFGNPEAHAAVLAPWLELHDSWAFLLPQTSLALSTAPALSVRLGVPYLSGALKYHFDGGEVSFVRESLFGKRTERWRPVSSKRILVAMIRQGIPVGFKPAGPGARVHMAPADPGPLRTRTLRREAVRGRETGLSRAAVVVAAGRGIGDERTLVSIRELLTFLAGSALGASRPVCDRGWLPPEHQVGVTGQTVSPRLYLAFGISGAIQHLAGMQDAQTIVAVNQDPEAPIFRIAHYAIVQDLRVFLPALLECLRNRRRTRTEPVTH